MSAEAWAATGAWAQVVVLVVTGILIYHQVSEARRLREAQERPFVVVDLQFDTFILYIRIRNIGSTVARDVRVSFDQPLESSIDDRADKINDAWVLNNSISTFVPGQEVRMLFDSFPQREAQNLPRTYVATVEYNDHDGKKKLGPEEYVLDLEPYAGTAVPDPGFPTLIKEITKIRKEMKKWTKAGSGAGLLVWNRDLDRGRLRSDRPIRIRRALNVKRKQGWVALGRHLMERVQEKRGLYER